MKVIPGFNVSGFIFAAAFFAGLGFGTSAFAQAKHSYLIDLNSKTATDIGTLGGTGIQDYTYASGINDVGQVVGYSPAYSPSGPGFSDDHAFITGPNGKGMTDLSFGGLRNYATGINAAGQVVLNVDSFYFGGGMPVVVSHAFITGPNGVGSTNLGTLGGESSQAVGINDTGQVVGTSDLPVGLGGPPFPRGKYDTHIFITGPNGVGMTDLANFGGRFTRPAGSTLPDRWWGNSTGSACLHHGP